MLKSIDKGKQLICLTFRIKFGELYLMLYCKNFYVLQHNTNVIEELKQYKHMYINV